MSDIDENDHLASDGSRFAPPPLKQLRERREECNVSQIEAAALSGVSRSSIRLAEGPDGHVSERTLKGIQHGLGLAPVGGYAFKVDDPNAYARPVLAPASVRSVADVLVPTLTDSPRLGSRLLLEYHELVDALAAKEPQPPRSLDNLRRHLAEKMTVEQMTAFNRDLATRFGPLSASQSESDAPSSELVPASGAFEKGKADARARYGPGGESAEEGFDLDASEVPTIGLLARSGLPGPYRAILGARLAEWQAELAVDLNKVIGGLHKFLDGPYHPGPGREFRPANLLEMKMLIWRCTPAARRQPAWQILVAIAQAAAVYIPVPAGAEAASLGDDFPWQFEIRHNDSGEPAGPPLLVIFTSPERMRDYLPEGFDAVPVKLQDLVPVWPGDALPYFNPASPISLLGSGVDNLADVVRLVGSAERRDDPLGEFG